MSSNDKDGFTGRECPACKGYFAVYLRTGRPKVRRRCHCIYCGHQDSPIAFWTQEQVSRCMAALAKAPHATTEVSHRAGKELGVGVDCDQCAVRFVAYGCFRACPRCGPRMPLAFFKANLAIIRNEVSLARELTPFEAVPLITKAYKDAHSVYEAFQREVDPGRWQQIQGLMAVLGGRGTMEPTARPFFCEQTERAKQRAGGSSVFDFPTEQLAIESILVEREKEVLDYLSLIEQQAESWVETCGDGATYP
jgi:hypothetical protein